MTSLLLSTGPETDERWKKQMKYDKKGRIFAFFVIASAIVFALSVIQQAGEFTFIKNLPSKANLAITIFSGAIFVVSCIAFLVLDKKERDLYKKVPDEPFEVLAIEGPKTKASELP